MKNIDKKCIKYIIALANQIKTLIKTDLSYGTISNQTKKKRTYFMM